MSREAPEVATGPTPDETPDETTELDGAETPESVDASAEQESESEETADETDDDQAAFATAQAYVNRKYGGDWKKFVDGLFSLQNSSAAIHKETKQLHEKLAAIEARLSQSKPDPEEERRVILQDEDVQSASARWKDADDEIKENEQSKNAIFKKIGELAETLAEKKGELRRADDLDKGQIQAEIDRLDERIENAKADHQRAEREIRRSAKAKEQAQKDFERAVKGVQNNKAREAQEQKAKEIEGRITNREYDDTIDVCLRSVGIDPDSDDGKYHSETVKEKLASALHRLGDDAPPVDITEATKAVFARYAKAMQVGERKAFAGMSRAKVQTLSSRPGAASSSAQSSTSPAQRQTEELSPKEKADRVRAKWKKDEELLIRRGA